jgi:hypothetical protein
LADWTEEKQRKILRFAMEGPAEKWLTKEEAAQGAAATAESLLVALAKRYGHSKALPADVFDLCQLVPARAETLVALQGRFRAMADRVEPPVEQDQLKGIYLKLMKRYYRDIGRELGKQAATSDLTGLLAEAIELEGRQDNEQPRGEPATSRGRLDSADESAGADGPTTEAPAPISDLLQLWTNRTYGQGLSERFATPHADFPAAVHISSHPAHY